MGGHYVTEEATVATAEVCVCKGSNETRCITQFSCWLRKLLSEKSCMALCSFTLLCYIRVAGLTARSGCGRPSRCPRKLLSEKSCTAPASQPSASRSSRDGDSDSDSDGKNSAQQSLYKYNPKDVSRALYKGK